MQETYSKDQQNRLNKKITQYYANDGELIDTLTSQFGYKEGRIVKEIAHSSTSSDEFFTTEYTYDPQGRLRLVKEDEKINVEYHYDDQGKVIKQANYIKGMNGEDKALSLPALNGMILITVRKSNSKAL